MLQLQFFNITNISFNAIHKNKILTKIPVFMVAVYAYLISTKFSWTLSNIFTYPVGPID